MKPSTKSISTVIVREFHDLYTKYHSRKIYFEDPSILNCYPFCSILSKTKTHVHSVVEHVPAPVPVRTVLALLEVEFRISVGCIGT